MTLRYPQDIVMLGWCSNSVSLTSWGEGAFLALVDHPSSDGVTIKISRGVHVLLHQPASHPIFSSGWLKLNLILL